MYNFLPDCERIAGGPDDPEAPHNIRDVERLLICCPLFLVYCMASKYGTPGSDWNWITVEKVEIRIIYTSI